MPSPFTWDITKPAGVDSINVGDDQIRSDKTTIRDVLRTLVPYGAATVGWRNTQNDNVNWLTQNAKTTDGTTWNRDDVAVASRAIRYNADGSLDFLYAAAAANPITWTVQNAFGIAGTIAIGTLPATTGDIRIPNATTGVVIRNAANSADYGALQGNASDQVVISASGNAIKWGKAVAALGGGAAPTVGTIGGAGPTVATQNSWLPVITSAGVAAFLPLWV